MGGCDFSAVGRGDSAEEAFNAAVECAQWESGHGGYTGTIAEKSSFKMVEVPEGVDMYDHVASLFDDEDHWINDKRGAAGCIDIKNTNRYYFFGIASC